MDDRGPDRRATAPSTTISSAAEPGSRRPRPRSDAAWRGSGSPSPARRAPRSGAGPCRPPTRQTSVPTSARSRLIARDRRDFTVPRGISRAAAMAASSRSTNQRRPMTSRSSAPSRSMAASSASRRSAARTDPSGDGAAPPERGSSDRRRPSAACREEPRRRLRAALATIRSSHGRGFGAGAEARQRPPGADEPLLGGIPSLVGIAADQEGSPVGDLLVSAHELLVGRDVPTPRPLHQFTVGQWTALHPARSIHRSTGFGSGTRSSAKYGRPGTDPREPGYGSHQVCIGRFRRVSIDW